MTLQATSASLPIPKHHKAKVTHLLRWPRRPPRRVAIALFGVGAAVAATLAILSGRDSGQATFDEPLPVTAENLLLNPGMEEGSAVPAHWSQGTPVEGVEYIWDQDHGQKGRSLCLHKTARRYFPIAQWHQTVPAQPDRRALHVSAQVKAESVTKAIIDVIFLDADDQWIAHEWVSYIGAEDPDDPPVSHDWREYSGRVSIPEGTRKLLIALQIYGPGKVWFDEVRARHTE